MSKADKTKLVGKLIEHYATKDKPDSWYGDTFDKLMKYPYNRLSNTYKYLQKKKMNENKASENS